MRTNKNGTKNDDSRSFAIRNKTSLLPVFSSIGIIDNGEGEGEDMLNKEAL